VFLHVDFAAPEKINGGGWLVRDGPIRRNKRMTLGNAPHHYRAARALN
jgi:hypothetical protein